MNVQDYVSINSKVTRSIFTKHKVLSADGLYDESLSEDLFHKVKVLCWVFTHPKNHESKAIHIKNLWGRRCNKLLFMSHEEDPVLGSIKLPVGRGRRRLWNKTIEAYKYVRIFWMKVGV
jgi:hypothetical protein